MIITPKMVFKFQYYKTLLQKKKSNSVIFTGLDNTSFHVFSLDGLFWVQILSFLSVCLRIMAKKSREAE